MRDGDRYPKTALQQALELRRAHNVIARRETDAAHGVEDESTLRRQVNALRGQPGVLKGALPVITARMSPADRATAQAKINGFQGFTPTQARDPRNIGSASSSSADLLKIRPGAPVSPLDAIPASVIRGSTPAEVSKFRAGDAVSVSDQATKDVAFTGKTVQTPYGTASSRSVKAGTPEAAAIVSDTGVSRAPAVAQKPWDVALVENYPAIGVAGSPENKAFVAKYRELADGSAKNPNFKFDPGQEGHRIAGELFDPKPDPAAVAKVAQAQNSKQDFLNRRGVGTPATTLGDLRKQDSAPPMTPTAMPAAPTTPAFTGMGDLRMQDAAAMSAAPAVPAPTPPPTAMDDIPGMHGYKTTQAGPTMPGVSGAPPKTAFNGSYTPDADTQAFAQNPEDDQFRKKLREPEQLRYA